MPDILWINYLTNNEKCGIMNKVRKFLKKYCTKKVLITFLFIYVIHNGCDFIWFTFGRWTDIHAVIVLIGIVLWSLVAALVLEKWHH